MPRLRGYREVQQFNFYDALFVVGPNVDAPSYAAVSSYRLFGNANIGDTQKNNTTVPGQLFYDCTGIISNVYARSSLPPSKELTTWAHLARATLKVGEKPRLQLPMVNLLRRTERQELVLGAVVDESDLIDDLSREAWLAYQHGLGKNITDPMGAWAGVSRADRDHWCFVAAAVKRRLSSPPYIIVPVRQNLSVVIEQDVEAAHALLATAASAPSGIWIHLEGFMSRDVG